MLIGTKSDLKDSNEDTWNRLIQDHVIEQRDFKNPITVEEGNYLLENSKP